MLATFFSLFSILSIYIEYHFFVLHFQIHGVQKKGHTLVFNLKIRIAEERKQIETSGSMENKGEQKTCLAGLQSINLSDFVTAQLNLNWSWSETLKWVGSHPPPPHPTTTTNF